MTAAQLKQRLIAIKNGGYKETKAIEVGRNKWEVSQYGGNIPSGADFSISHDKGKTWEKIGVLK